MPTIFWKDHNAKAQASIDAPSLRERYIADGEKAAGPLAKDENVFAIWISGPFEMPRISPGSDLHMGVLLRRGRGSFYRHVIPPFSNVGRRLEIAFFALEPMQAILEKGFTNWNAVFDIHTLREIVILHERDGILTEMRRTARALRPTRLFIGREIEELKKEFELADRHLREGAFGESVLTSRRIMLHSLQLMVLAGKGETFSKARELYAMLTQCLPPLLVEGFELGQSTRGLCEREARHLVDAVSDLVTDCFERTIA